jgi:hypothetical protein
MAKAENKTKPTGQSPKEFVASVEHPVRRADAERLLEIFARVTNLAPRMWGPSLIGYGRYAYKYESGREGEFFMTGFSPRKANLVVYIMPGYLDLEEKLARLGKYKLGKSCLYINKLADVDEAVLAEIIDFGLQYMRGKYETWDE